MQRAHAWVGLALGLAVACSSSSPSSGPGGGTSSGAPASTGDAGLPPQANPGESQVSFHTPKDQATQLVVGIDAEDFASQGYMVRALEVVVTVDGVVAARETLDAEAGALFPHAVRLVAPKDRPNAAVAIKITARAPGADLVLRTAKTAFVAGRTRLAYLFLETRCTLFGIGGGGSPPGPTCTNPGETCIGGACAPDALGALPDFTADWATNPPSACGTGAAGELLVGKGQTAFAPVADGDTLTPECGPQGGHHLWMALRMKNVGQFGSKTVLSATQPAGTASVPLTGFAYAWAPAAAGQCELVGVRFQLDVGATPVAAFLGKPLDITATTDDKAGHHASIVSHVTIATAPVGPFCH